MSPVQKKKYTKEEIKEIEELFNNNNNSSGDVSSFSENSTTLKIDLFNLCMSYLENQSASIDEIVGSLEIVKNEIQMYFTVDFVTIMKQIIASGVLDEDDDEEIRLTEEDLKELRRGD